MQSWILPPDRFIKLNGWDEVRNPISFEKGMIPSADGLFSTDIFGMSMDDRKNRFGFIDLKRKYLTPKAYIALIRLNRKVQSIVYGTKKFTIQNGELIEDENGQTGMDWLYKNWDSINFQKGEGAQRNDRVDVLSGHSKNELFMDKFIVIPAFYRDVNMQQASSGSPRVPEINDTYNNILRNISLIEAQNNFDFMVNSLIGKTQQLIVDVYNQLKAKIEKKNGYLRKFVMGKSVDYCTRVVITAADFRYDSWKAQPIDFEHTGCPLIFCLSMLTPFILWWVKGFFKTELENTKDSCPVILKDGKKVYVKLESPEIFFNNEYIEKVLQQYIDQPSSRFDKIELPIQKEYKEKYGITYPIYIRLKGRHPNVTTMDKHSDFFERPLTWTDIFYMAAVDVSEDKFVQITRFPLLDYLGTLFTRIFVMSTRNTTPMIINDRLYEYYPVIDTEMDVVDIESLFIDSLKLFPIYLSAIGGDHDGDQITAKILFTMEANADALKIMNAKTNLISINGDAIRKIGNEGSQTLYTMTRFH